LIDASWKGRRSEVRTTFIEEGALKLFAKILGIEDPIHTDRQAALAAGYRGIVAPPTYPFSINLNNPSEEIGRDSMGVDLGKVLHGEQHFTPLKDICAGDTIRITNVIADFYTKKNGQLTFVVSDTELHNQFDELCVRMRNVMVIRA
jgi:acyl dehydratase